MNGVRSPHAQAVGGRRQSPAEGDPSFLSCFADPMLMGQGYGSQRSSPPDAPRLADRGVLSGAYALDARPPLAAPRATLHRFSPWERSKLLALCAIAGTAGGAIVPSRAGDSRVTSEAHRGAGEEAVRHSGRKTVACEAVSPGRARPQTRRLYEVYHTDRRNVHDDGAMLAGSRARAHLQWAAGTKQRLRTAALLAGIRRRIPN